ncbi:MAG: hypothetical protein KC454_00235 [Flavobacteriales bacterium]|nr:hypothetical protein [Flavobacteriales bacterium]
MKKVILAFSLFMFVGSFGATAFAASTDTQIEFRNNDDKKKKKKKKKSSKKSCAAKCSAEKSAPKTASCCKKK